MLEASTDRSFARVCVAKTALRRRADFSAHRVGSDALQRCGRRLENGLFYADIAQAKVEDPIKFAGGDTNLYAYVGNDPVNFKDPDGLMKLPADPSQLGPDWVQDPRHGGPKKDTISLWKHKNGKDQLEFHKATGKGGPQNHDHYHHNGQSRHLRPGMEIPDPEAVCDEEKQSYSTIDDPWPQANPASEPPIVPILPLPMPVPMPMPLPMPMPIPIFL